MQWGLHAKITNQSKQQYVGQGTKSTRQKQMGKVYPKVKRGKRQREGARQSNRNSKGTRKQHTKKYTVRPAKRAVIQKPQGREQKEGREHEVRRIETFRITEQQRNKVES